MTWLQVKAFFRRLAGEIQIMSEPLLRVPATAQILDVSPNMVYELIRRGVFPPGVVIKVSPKRGFRFHPGQLSAWLASGGLQNQTPLSEGSERVIAA